MNGMSPEILFLMERAQVLANTEGNITHRALASDARTPGVVDRIAFHTMSSRQPGRSSTSLSPTARSWVSMPDEPKRRERQMASRKSDCPIGAVKPGNSGGAKGAEPSPRSWPLIVRTQRRSNGEAVRSASRACADATMRWLGAGCVNGARPVLRGAGVSNG